MSDVWRIHKTIQLESVPSQYYQLRCASQQFDNVKTFSSSDMVCCYESLERASLVFVQTCVLSSQLLVGDHAHQHDTKLRINMPSSKSLESCLRAGHHRGSPDICCDW